MTTKEILKGMNPQSVTKEYDNVTALAKLYTSKVNIVYVTAIISL